MRDRAADMGGVGGAILGGVTTATQGAFLSGRQQSIADERLAAMAAAGGNGPPNMRGSFGAAAADPEYLARMSAASHHATGAMRQRYTQDGIDQAASGVLNQIAPAGWANRAIGKIFGN